MEWRKYFKDAIVIKYDEEQPRDESGRWSSSGSSTVGSDSKHAGRGSDEKTGVRVLATVRTSAGQGKKSEYGTMSAQTFIEQHSLNTGIPMSRDQAKQALNLLDGMAKRGEVEIVKTTIPQRVRDKDGTVVQKDIEVLSIKPTDKGISEVERIGKHDKFTAATHSISAERPYAFNYDKDSLVAQAMEIRREEFPDTRHGAQGRFFSSNKEAPELTFDAHKQFENFVAKETAKLEKANAINQREGKTVLTPAQIKIAAESAAQSKVEKNLDSGMKSRQDVYGHETGRGSKGQIDFYDAVSSQNALIGVIMNRQELMEQTKLINPEVGAKKPYFTSFNAVTDPKTGKTHEAIDYKNPAKTMPFLADKPVEVQQRAVKEMAKATFTAGGYGSGRGSEKAMGAGGTVPATLAVMEKYGLRTKGDWDPELVRDNGKVGGYKPLTGKEKENYDKAVSIAHQMRANLDNHASTEFTKEIRNTFGALAGTDFVYVNPVDGYRMSLDKHYTGEVKQTIGGHRLRVAVPSAPIDKKTGERKDSTVNARGTRSGASAIFIQSIDKAALGLMMTELKSPYTIHDSIGMHRTGSKAPTETPAKIQKAVAKAYETIRKADLLGDLEKQAKKHLEHQVKTNRMHAKAAAAKMATVKQALDKLRSMQNIKTYNFKGNQHFEAEPHKQFKRRK